MAESGRLDELKRKFDENPRRYFAPLANEYRKAGDWDRAIELCRTYLPQQPSHMSGYIVYGQALSDAGRTDEAAAVFKQALTLDPENIIALRYLGDIARGEGDSAGAMRWYGKVLELDPRDEEIAGHITALASPSARPIPRNERAAPPTIRPEPEFDASAVALAQLVAEPDEPQQEIAQQPASAPRSSGDAPRASPTAGQRPAHEGAPDAMRDAVRNSARDAEPEPEPEPGRAPEPEAPAEPLIIFEESFEVISWPSTTASSQESSGGGQRNEAQREDREQPDAHSPFITETMAELYVQQGLTDDALVIYRQLVVRGEDPRLQKRIVELEGRAAGLNASGSGGPGSTGPEAAVPEAASVQQPAREPAQEPSRESVREFFARIGAVKAQAHVHLAAENESGLSRIFGSATSEHAEDLSAAQSLAGAFGAARADSDSSRD